MFYQIPPQNLYVFAFIGFFVALMLLLKKKRRLSNALLSIFILFVLIESFLLPLNRFCIFSSDKPIFQLGYALPFLAGPLLVTFIRSFLNPGYTLSKSTLYHGILFITVLVLSFLGSTYSSPFSFFYSEATEPFFKVVKAFHISWYGVLSFKEIWSFSNREKPIREFETKKVLNTIVVSALVVWTFFIFNIDINFELLGHDLSRGPYPIAIVISFIFILWVGYQNLLKTYLVNLSLTPLAYGFTSDNNQSFYIEKKYTKSGLKKDASKQLYERMIAYLDEDEVYLDCHLKLGDVARYLDTTPNYLSQAINTWSVDNFFNIINNYRIEKAKIILSNPDNKDMKILAVAFDSGFNSKSTFYRVFKKHTGYTPTQFKKRHSSP